ncbi:B-cell antigen receptor complex-associated protein beta chain isoform X1 [Sturnira hondurensis]|uniref:B-cell antigen receptor complex-associated protein beta chain isoform X1 n=1 Tax=Sturnira hondurensis TaxID=192404 RepID=UPI00187A5E86|nr:B-cell antigen receptor complex-associated protein beta chain isoform X1 [Sturnira hondurensis]
MAGPELSPVPSNWLLVLLMLLAGETVFAAQMLDPVQNPRGSPCSQIWQYPRFVAKKRGSVVEIKCILAVPGHVSWLWKRDMNSESKEVTVEPGHIQQNQTTLSATLTIKGIQFQDNGIYFCQQECQGRTVESGCGTELRVLGYSTFAQLKRRNALKDGIIMIQTTLIILFITVPIFLLLDKDDSKPGMEEDHTYEGLNVDQTATYEDIVTLRTGEVKWSVGEHPGQE